MLHRLHADAADVDARDAQVALLQQLFGELGVARAHVQDALRFVEVRRQDVLQPAEPLVPVEGLRVSALGELYLVYLSSQYSVFP